MASQPPYPIDDIQPPDVAPAPETETASSATDPSAVPTSEIPAEPSAEPDPIEPVTDADDAEAPAPTSAPGTIPAPAAPVGAKSVRGGNMFMRVLSRAMQDLDVVTGGTRAATYDEVNAYVGHAIRTEHELERSAIAAQTHAPQPAEAAATVNDSSGARDQGPDQHGDPHGATATDEALPASRLPDGRTVFDAPHAQSATYWRSAFTPADPKAINGMGSQPKLVEAAQEDPALQQVDFRPLDFWSPYVKRSKHYWELQTRLENAGDHDSYYFKSVAKMTANLANMDAPYGGLADLDPQVRAYSEKLSQAIAAFNDGQIARILAGKIPERGPALDSKLVVDEQQFIQARLDSLRKSNKPLYDDVIAGINRNANVTGWKSLANSITDESIHRAADATRRSLGRPIDFANIKDRIAMGNQMTKEMRMMTEAANELQRQNDITVSTL